MGFASLARPNRHWAVGQSLVFDDTHTHEAWNDSDELRVVLFVDFLRQLPFPVSLMNQIMIKLIAASPFIKNMMTNLSNIKRIRQESP